MRRAERSDDRTPKLFFRERLGQSSFRRNRGPRDGFVVETLGRKPADPADRSRRYENFLPTNKRYHESKRSTSSCRYGSIFILPPNEPHFDLNHLNNCVPEIAGR